MTAAISRRNATFFLASGVLAIAWLGSRGGKPASRLAVPEVDVTRAKEMMDAGAIIIDVRSKEAFDYRHLPPALQISLAILSTGIPASLAAAKERQIVVYCNDGHASGPEAAQLLLQHGFVKVANMKGGIEGWAASGLPLVKAS